MDSTPPPRFEVIRTLGDGGMGTVYLALMRGEGGFEKQVALKVLKPELSTDPESVELFVREARLAAQLNHPHIVQVFDGGLERGNLYLVQEYVDGGTLEDLIRRGRQRGRAPSPVAIAQVGAQVCEALCAMFDLRDETGAPVVQAHRDISPGNVLLSRAGVAKLSDFGVVRLRESKTAVGKVRGKWEYFPPELIHGIHDQRGDLFALGITLYKVAALVHPFAAPTAPQRFERACRDELQPIAGLPPALMGILARALTKDPQQRYQTADEMGSDLESFVSSTYERTSPRYLARELFSTEPRPGTPAVDPAADLFGASGGSPPATTPPSEVSRPITGAKSADAELREFEELFGPMPERTQPAVAMPQRETSSTRMLVLTGAPSEAQLREFYAAFAQRYRAHRGSDPVASFEQMALMIQSRRQQLVQRFPQCAVALQVVLENDRVIVRLRPVDRTAASTG